MEDKNQYKIDRIYVTAMSFDVANNHTTYWPDKTEDERLKAACFLINQLYGVLPRYKS